MDNFINLFNNLGQDYIYGLALTALICINVGLGSWNAWLNKTWDREKFIRGFLNGLGIALAVYFTYLVGGLIPDLLVITTTDAEINLQTAISLAMVAGIYHYGKDIVTKIQAGIGGKTV